MAGGNELIDSYVFGAQVTDISYGRYPDGVDAWGFMATATPGATNSPHNAPPTISGTTHTPASPGPTDPVWVTATVTDDNTVVSVTLTYDASGGPQVVTMYDDGAHSDGGVGDDMYGGQIPAFPQDTVVDYYVTATDDVGAEITDPADAPTATYSYLVGYVPPALYINEFMADNDTVYEDPENPGDFDDWIEIYNAGVTTVDLSGMYLTDDLADPVQWQVPPGVTIPAGGYLLFWADDEEVQGDTHTNFKLGASGEEIGLYDTDANGNVAVDALSFGEQSTDVSYGRCPDGAGVWALFSQPTPGLANSACDAVSAPLPEDSLGLTCTDDAQCDGEARCVSGICYAPKHRYLSIARNPAQATQTARRVCIASQCLGWVGQPVEHAGSMFASLVPSPIYADIDFAGEWPDVVHVSGCEIATGQTYLVQAIRAGQDMGDDGNYSLAVELHTPTVWADVVSTCFNNDCLPPDGAVGIDDVLAGITKFQGFDNAPITWLDIDPSMGSGVPNLAIDIGDILATLGGFQGESYPGDGPTGCQ